MKREDFPILKDIIYLDSAAGALKPVQVVKAISDFYINNPINPHSVDSQIGSLVMKQINKTRELVAELIDASSNEIIFTSGTTDGLNRLALMFKAFLKKGDEIVISKYNHISNIIPWIEIAKEKGVKIVLSKDLISDISDKTKVICYSQLNNTLKQNIDHSKVLKEAKKHNAVLVNDAAQAIVHEEVSLNDFDVIVFSGNKLYGPTGTGVLAIKKELLQFLRPSTFGGGAAGYMSGTNWESKEGIKAFEAGTPNTAGIIGLGAAIEYFNNIDHSLEKEVAIYAHEELSKIEGMKLMSRKGDMIILFNYKNYNSQDIVSYLGNKGILLRSGVHCAKLITEIIDVKFSVRLSLGAYNNKNDIDKLIKEIKNGGDFIDFI